MYQLVKFEQYRGTEPYIEVRWEFCSKFVADLVCSILNILASLFSVNSFVKEEYYVWEK